jgi:hypothetical protein
MAARNRVAASAFCPGLVGVAASSSSRGTIPSLQASLELIAFTTTVVPISDLRRKTSTGVAHKNQYLYSQSIMEYEQSPRVQAWANCDAFVLIAAMNPCPCGYYGDDTDNCTCSPGIHEAHLLSVVSDDAQVHRYPQRISRPIPDCITGCSSRPAPLPIWRARRRSRPLDLAEALQYQLQSGV